MSDLRFQVANIGESDEGEHFCFGWVRGIEDLDDAVLERTAVALMLKAGDEDSPVEVEGLGPLCESMVFTSEKQELLGINLGGSKWWVGVRVPDRKTWRALRSNQEFSLLGVSLQGTGLAGERERIVELRKLNDDVVELCKRAARTGDLAGISRQDVETCLERMAEAEAQRRDVTVERGYDLVLKSADGAALYSVLDRLRPGTAA